MFVDRGVGNLDDVIRIGKNIITGEETVNIAGESVGLPDVAMSPQVEGMVRRKLDEAKLGEKIGKQIGCGIASGFEGAVPKAVWGSEGKLGPCAPSDGPKKTPSAVESFADNVTAPSLARAKRVAAQIAEPRIEARLKPWFIGLPIAGLLVGVGLTYLVMNRTRPKR